jgi:Xaa-Pro aminopeptidase
MRTLQPTLRLGRDVWDQAAMPVEEFRDRAERLRAAMAPKRLDALLLYGSGLNECGHPTYLSNYVVKLPFSALAVLPRTGEPALMFQGATRGRSAAKATTWIEDVRPCWNMAATCLAVLAERGLTTATIGLAGMPRLVPAAEWQTLVAGLDRATLMDAEGLVDEHRAIKSAREIAQVQRASRIVDYALRSLTTIRAAIVDEASVAAHVIREARMLGAEDIRLLIARPQEVEWAFRPPEEATIHVGETVFVYLSASQERYWSEATRTCLVRSDGLDLVWNDDLEARFSDLVSAVSPGVPVATYVRTATAAMTPSEAKIIDTYGLGHGIGVTPEEPPVLSADDRSTIQQGMCLAIRAAFSNRHGLVLHSDTVVV